MSNELAAMIELVRAKYPGASSEIVEAMARILVRETNANK